jgi:hypothetical protein
MATGRWYQSGRQESSLRGVPYQGRQLDSRGVQFILHKRITAYLREPNVGRGGQNIIW